MIWMATGRQMEPPAVGGSNYRGSRKTEHFPIPLLVLWVGFNWVFTPGTAEGYHSANKSPRRCIRLVTTKTSSAFCPATKHKVLRPGLSQASGRLGVGFSRLADRVYERGRGHKLNGANPPKQQCGCVKIGEPKKKRG